MPSGGSRRRVLVIADQAASSLSNVVVAVLVARSFPDQTEPFAAFGLALMVFQFLVGCVRALVFEPVLSLYPDRPRAERDALVPGYLGSTLTVGTGVAILVALASVVVEGMAGSALLALALVVPFVLVQDSWRYLFIIDRPGAALAVDLVWLAVSCSAIVVMPDDVSVSWYVVAWGAGGTLGGAVATLIGRRALGRPELWGHVVRHRQLGLRFLGEVLTSQASNYALLSCGWILGLNAYGAVRAVNFFFGPLMTLNAGLLLSILPEATRLRGQPARFVRLVYGATAVASAAAVGWTVVGLVLPESAGRAFFGVTWVRAQDVLLPMGVAVIGLGIVTTMLAGVRALDGTKGLGARLRGVPFQVGCPIVGAFAGGIMGFAIGMALGVGVSAAIWWTTFRRLYDHQRRAVAEGLASASTQVASGTPLVAQAFAVTDEA